jgi:hypothetical protein
MVQSIGSSVVGKDIGFDKLARFGPQKTKPQADTQPASDAVRTAKSARDTAELSAEQQRLVNKLKQTDAKVRAHEQAHISVGADLIRGGPTYSYETGPDNKRYAVSGEVSIDTTPGRTPEETVPKAQHIRATALAPAEPSAQDRSVAAQASQMEQQAVQELFIRKREESAAESGNGAQFYRRVERSDGEAAPVGNRLDLFA